MNQDIWNCLILSSFFLALFGIGEWMYHFKNVRAEFTRKWSHIGTGILTLLFPIMLSSHWYVLLMCSSFAVLLVASMKLNFLKSINAVDRETLGSVLYPLSVYICFLAMSWSKAHYTAFYLPVLSLAIADPMAALAGKKWGIKKYAFFGHEKSYVGSMACALTAAILCFTALNAQWQESTLPNIIVFTIIYAVIIAVVEAISVKGWDNFTIPITGVLLLQWGSNWV